MPSERLRYQLFIAAVGIIKGLSLAAAGKFVVTACGDEASYIFFDFSSLKAILSNFRTPGLPILVRFYEIFFDHYGYWPIFQYVLFLLSIVFFLSAMLSVRLAPLVAVAMATGVLIGGPILLPSICSEPTAMAFVLCAIGSAMLFAERPTRFRGLVLGAALQRLLGVRTFEHLKAAFLQIVGDDQARELLVLDHEDDRRGLIPHRQHCANWTRTYRVDSGGEKRPAAARDRNLR
jgi:hypothetical protein